MFLKSLKIQGFKSFAERTTLEFTPGVAVIVGPNGSGKSNLVDAIAWVLGEQGPTSLRGGRMEDVIFAGTAKRGASGRAEVSLTIDNNSGLLPIEFTEVTITRTIFRGGDSEYSINGVTCRLLDVQELLSDSGIGRELHTIVGQGQLEAVLSSRPEERRAYIEEAAGILKFRRRKERSLRKLERTDTDIERLADVIAELRRQIRPLEQQAETARRAAEIEAELRAARLSLWAFEYAALLGEGDREAEERLSAEAARLAGEARALAERGESLESELAAVGRLADEARTGEYRLESIRERAQGLGRLAEERRKHLEDLVRRAPTSVAPSAEEIGNAEESARQAEAESSVVEVQARQAEEEWLALSRAQQEAVRSRQEALHLEAESAGLRGAIGAAEEEHRRLEERRGSLAERRDARSSDLREVSRELKALDDRETDLTREFDATQARLEAQREVSRGLRAAVAEAERTVAELDTKRGVLEAEVARTGGVDLLERFSGLLGRAAAMVRAAPGWELAVRAAVEPVAGAIVASSDGDAVLAVRHLRGTGGRGAFIVPGPAGSLPDSLRPLSDVVTDAPASMASLLARVGVAETLEEALTACRAHPGLIVVTRDGDRVGPDEIAGGDPAALQADVQAEHRDVCERLAVARERLDQARERLAEGMRAVDALESESRSLTSRLNDLDAEISGAADRLADLEREEHAAVREDGVIAGRIAEVEERRSREAERAAQVEAQLARVSSKDGDSVDPAALAIGERRASEKARELGAAAEREGAARRLVADLRARARRAEEEHAAWESARQAREEAASRAGKIAAAAVLLCERVQEWISQARAERASVEERREALTNELTDARRRRHDAEAQAEEAREIAHRSDLARAERSHRLMGMAERLRAEHDMSPEDVPAPDGDPEELRRRAGVLERRLGLLGRVNAIAMEHYQGLLDRHKFLSEQMADLRKSRRDLASVVEEVDSKIAELFDAAFGDVSREFTQVFTRLFPGGEGRLLLTNPEDPLESGVDVEARPGGKRVKRLSLLSGGERALTAIALLASIFRARPSPFYLLDEVEAALDDVNLHRFLELVREFKDGSQILVVTHQKRTMEVADVLYGISMGSDGSTRVVSQRLEDVPVAG